MKIVVFLDLDDSIFQTRPKCPEGAAVWPVAYRRDGTALSFMTTQQRTLVETLFRQARVIPTTARNLDALQRVDLPFSDVRILNFGGVVLLPDGSLDREWDAEIRPRSRETSGALDAARKRVQCLSQDRQLGVTARVIGDFDMPLYLVVKHPEGDSAKLASVREYLLGAMDRERFFLHGNDNNLSLVPRFLGKERAVRHVLERHLGPEPTLTIGLGDSLTDAPFLNLCDFSMLPRACQLARHFAKEL